MGSNNERNKDKVLLTFKGFPEKNVQNNNRNENQMENLDYENSHYQKLSQSSRNKSQRLLNDNKSRDAVTNYPLIDKKNMEDCKSKTQRFLNTDSNKNVFSN